MAKRKRLTAPLGDFLSGPAHTSTGPAPIASVAGAAAEAAALAELSSAMQSARDEGRLIEALPLEAVETGHLVRDRLVLEDDEMATLMASLASRGQQTPIEVVRLESGRFGLISGWRRLTALTRLHAETGEDRFASVRARVIAPPDAEAAYVAMVEENEIRVNLSHYERARIAWRAEAEGVFPSLKAALQGLYAAVPRAKRSKIRSFVVLVEALDDVLRFPTAISEKLGLALAKALEGDAGLAARLRADLEAAAPVDAAAELAVLGAALAPAPKPKPDLTRYDITGGLALTHWPGNDRIELSGHQVDDALLRDLKDWLERR
ncbi:MAG: ParB/RepB/Spo0J family partition protein [Marinibacterium sp.]